MYASQHASASSPPKTPCPHCGKTARTLITRNYGIRIDGGVQQSVPMNSRWRCFGCGKTFATANE